jgi:hypothetical protein
MNEREMYNAYNNGNMVRVTNHDYKFEGRIAAIFNKLLPDTGWGAYGDVRCVVQNADGILHIQHPKNLELLRG